MRDREAVWRAVHDLRHHSKRLHRARADAGYQQELGEIDGRALGCRGERAVQPAGEDVASPHVVMRRHDEMRQRQLRRGLRCRPLMVRHHAVRPKRRKQVELGVARFACAAVGEIDDLALRLAVDCVCGSSIKFVRPSDDQ